jgi:phospholipid/cholesterol/gamma-HCH transport system ATP-binding protein
MQMTNIVVTHVMESVFRIADHIVMLDKGLVILDGSLEELRSSPDPRIKHFVSGEIDALSGNSERHDAFVRDLLL